MFHFKLELLPLTGHQLIDVLDLLTRGDDEFCVDNDDSGDDSIDEEMSETIESNPTSTETEDDFLDSEETLPDESLSNPGLVQNMNSFLNNPSITTRPQVPSQCEWPLYLGICQK